MPPTSRTRSSSALTGRTIQRPRLTRRLRESRRPLQVLRSRRNCFAAPPERAIYGTHSLIRQRAGSLRYIVLLHRIPVDRIWWLSLYSTAWLNIYRAVWTRCSPPWLTPRVAPFSRRFRKDLPPSVKSLVLFQSP